MDSEKNEQSKKKMSMADRFITAMFLPGEYSSLLELTVGKVITYLILLIMLICVIQFGIPVLAALAGYGGVRNYIINELPDFSLEDGSFTLSEKYEKEDEMTGMYILIDTETDEFTKEDVPDGYVQAMLISHSNIIMYNGISGVSGPYEEQKFSELKGVTFNNNSVADLAPIIYIFMGLVFAVLYLAMMVRYLIAALFYALILFVLSRFMSGNVSYGTIYKIALFAQTIGSIVSAVAVFIGTPIFVTAGSTFAMIATVLIMNRAYFKIAALPKAN